jgi:GNAT superfamily N-acetyltransferase
MSAPVGVRLATADDMRFVAASWFESYWKAVASQEGMDYLTAYRPGQDALIRRLVGRSETIVAHAVDIPDEILGYAVLEDDVLHYVYVKSVYRRRGIATGLVRARAKRYSQRTRLGEKLVKPLALEFNPYATHGAIT